MERRFGIQKKIKKYGPQVGAAALALGTIAAGAYVYSNKPSSDPSFGTIAQQKQAVVIEDKKWAETYVRKDPLPHFEEESMLVHAKALMTKEARLQTAREARHKRWLPDD